VATSDPNANEMRSLKKLAVTTFHGTTLIFSVDESDIESTVKVLKGRK